MGSVFSLQLVGKSRPWTSESREFGSMRDYDFECFTDSAVLNNINEYFNKEAYN